jgi:hypothetical protein
LCALLMAMRAENMYAGWGSVFCCHKPRLLPAS